MVVFIFGCVAGGGGKLSGIYYSDNSEDKNFLEFLPDSKVIYSYRYYAGNSSFVSKMEYTYSVNDKKLRLTGASGKVIEFTINDKNTIVFDEENMVYIKE